MDLTMLQETMTIENEISESTAPEYRRFPSARFYASVIIMVFRFVILTVTISFAISAVSWLPDVDLVMPQLLHHRSIVTHSILVPGVLYFGLRRLAFASPAMAIIFAAMSVHLFADVLSPPIGFGQIWLPFGSSLSLGILSPIFIFTNAVLAFYLAIVVFPESLRSEISGAALLTGFLYGIVNEGSAVAAGFILAMLTTVIGVLLWRGNITETPWKVIHEFRRQRDVEIAANIEYVDATSADLLNFSSLRRAYLHARGMIIGIYTVCRWVAFHPKKAMISVGAVAAIALLLYTLGASGEGSSEGILQTVGNGVWKLHSSGGYILTEGGHYVAGTLTDAPPE
jgi:hypothetical protein